MNKKNLLEAGEWTYEERKIIQILPAGDWLAVYEIDGKRETLPIAGSRGGRIHARSSR